jgi:hypothetical protein
VGDSILSTISFSFWVLWGIVFIVLLTLVISVIRRNLRTQRAPVRKIQAQVIKLEQAKGPLSPLRGTFKTVEGERLLLFIDRSRSTSLFEGQSGELSYKGNTFISFDRTDSQV